MDVNRLLQILKFLVPSLLGAALFMLPVTMPDGSQTMLSGLVVDGLETLTGSLLVPALVALCVVSAVMTVWHQIRPVKFIAERPYLNDLISTTAFWAAVRVVGAVLMVMVYIGVGPAAVVSDDSGGNILYTIIPSCALWYLVGGVFLPLLTDYGLVDLFSALFRRFARPVFRVPGNAMVDCVSSWLGSSVCGVYMTLSQYEKGFYTAREAVTLLSGFELLSISFCSMIASMLGLGPKFGLFYLTIVVAGLVCAVVIPRLWPITGVSDEYYQGHKELDEEIPEGKGSLEWGLSQAVSRAQDAPSVLGMLAKGLMSALNLMVSSLPSIMTIGTMALILAMHTNLFDYLGAPLGVYFQLLGVENSMEAGSMVLAGFADQFVPVILGTTVASEGTRFLVGCLAILQILYMTDVGSLILTSKVPFKFWQIFLVYLERILISAPIVVACAHVFGIM